MIVGSVNYSTTNYQLVSDSFGVREGGAVGERYLDGYAGGGVEDGACCVALLADVVEEGFVFDFDERIACGEIAVSAYERGGVLLAVPVLERQFAFCRRGEVRALDSERRRFVHRVMLILVSRRVEVLDLRLGSIALVKNSRYRLYLRSCFCIAAASVDGERDLASGKCRRAKCRRKGGIDVVFGGFDDFALRFDRLALCVLDGSDTTRGATLSTKRSASSTVW